MIKKLKRKFVLLATVSSFILMTILISTMNIINYSSVIRESDNILNMISEPSFPFHKKDEIIGEKPVDKPIKDNEFLPHGMSPEVPYESRYFIVKLSSDGEIIETNIDRIISVDESTIERFVSKSINNKKDRGFVDNFRFLKTFDENTETIIFLDSGRRMDAFNRFMWSSIGIGLSGCVVVFALFLVASSYIVKPMAISQERQKRFISDASHEIKTPLTVIQANVDLLELEMGENECIDDIRDQAKRLTVLTNDLVSLSRMEESKDGLLITEFPLSDLVLEEANVFDKPMALRKIDYKIDITPDISYNGSPDAIRKLVSILLDNCLKYSIDSGDSGISLSRNKKEVILKVYNKTNEMIKEEDIPRLFDRFYRADSSRNSETGGHGIGLSIAKAIVDSHNGKIKASVESENLFTITAIFPI